MHVFSLGVRRAAIAVGCVAAMGFTVITAATAPAQAQPAAASAHSRSVQPVPFSSCNYGVSKGWPLVALQTSVKKIGFGYTGPYNLVVRNISGPFLRLYNYSNCRVWLHQTAESSEPGWSVCFNPRRFNHKDATSVAIPVADEYAESMLISGNTSHCPER
jgi:hypothetical protein